LALSAVAVLGLAAALRNMGTLSIWRDRSNSAKYNR
jgi:hypothetical protein